MWRIGQRGCHGPPGVRAARLGGQDAYPLKVLLYNFDYNESYWAESEFARIWIPETGSMKILKRFEKLGADVVAGGEDEDVERPDIQMIMLNMDPATYLPTDQSLYYILRIAAGQKKGVVSVNVPLGTQLMLPTPIVWHAAKIDSCAYGLRHKGEAVKLSHRVVASFEGVKELGRLCTKGPHTHVNATDAKKCTGIMLHLFEKALADVIWQNAVPTRVGQDIGEPRDLDLVEFGAGAGVLSAEAQRRGLAVEKMDILYRPDDDFSTTQGRVRARILARRIKPGGVGWISVNSSWWVWCIRHAAGRTEHVPEGDVQKERVRKDNQIASFFAGICKFLHTRDVAVVWETPTTSLIPQFLPVRKAMADIGAVSVRTPLGAYGAATTKVVHPLGTSRALAAVPAPLPTKSETLQLGKHETDRWQASSQYPQAFTQKFSDGYFCEEKIESLYTPKAWNATRLLSVVEAYGDLTHYLDEVADNEEIAIPGLEGLVGLKRIRRKRPLTDEEKETLLKEWTKAMPLEARSPADERERRGELLKMHDNFSHQRLPTMLQSLRVCGATKEDLETMKEIHTPCKTC